MLNLNNVTKAFGGVVAVNNVTVTIEEKKMVGLIGPNGAGKTTLMNIINGLYKLDSGDIYFKDRQINGLPTHKIASLGIGRTFQIPRVFKSMTTLENVIVAGKKLGLDETELMTRVEELIKFFKLEHVKDEFAGNLSTGQQKFLEIPRSMILDPDLLLLDEPFHGVHPSLKNKICDRLIRLNEDQGITMLITSHDIPSIMKICTRLIVLDNGFLIADGPAEECRCNEKVIEAYLGV